MTARSARVLARSAWTIVLLLGLLQMVLLIMDRSARIQVYGFRGFQWFIALAIVWIGSLVITRRPQNPIGLLYCVAAIIGIAQGALAEYAIFSLYRHHGSLPLAAFTAWAQNWIWIPLIAAAGIFVFQLFPDGHLLSPRWRKAFIFSGFGTAVFAAVFSVQPGQIQQVAVGYLNPYHLPKRVAGPAMGIGALLFIATIAVAVTSVAVRFRRARGEEREQLKWVVFAAVFLLAAFVANGISSGITQNSPVQRGAAIYTILSLAWMVAATGVAVLKYRLYDIDVVISRAVVVSSVAVFISAVYVAIVAGIGAAVRGTSRSTLWLSVLATAIVAVALQPLRERARRIANRIAYGERATPYEALSEFASGISEAYSIDDVLPRLARLMTEATAAVRGTVWLSSGAELRAAAVWPEGAQPAPRLDGDAVVDGPASAAAYPVRHQGEILGELTVATRPGESLTPIDQKVLSDLAAQAGLVLRNVHLITDLQASRQRLVTAQDQERRRIERNLHDGAQQQLVALAVQLRLARTMLGTDPTQVDGLLERLQAEAQDALENLRALAHGIYPPLLAERGLTQALTTQAEKSPLHVTVLADGLSRYPQEAEAAIYFCVLECMQNAAKYSSARNVEVRLAGESGRLTFHVTDDGVGFDAATTPHGAGLTNMADRIEALGGTLHVVSAPGQGTIVSGWLVAAPRD